VGTHKEIKKDYAKLLSEFCDMFGEDGEAPPDSLCRPEMVSARDEWHRRKILRLQGNTYMNIFALYGKFCDMFGLMRLFTFRSAQLSIIAFKESLCPPTKPRAIFMQNT
jgi:hypothetical protein